MKHRKHSHPLWETAVMIGSFALLWVWFLARQAAAHNGGSLWPGWAVLQIVALIALAVITVRRMGRVRRALRGEDKDGFPPSRFPPPNGHPRKRELKR
jgi:type VI protein secretion system component VasK